MRIVDLQVSNFRAISSIHLSDLEDVVVIAGPNGCGKSCILDAIRLFKSAYGSYRQQDELQSWFGEFQVKPDAEPRELLSFFQDRSRELRIAATVRLASSERDYLQSNIAASFRDRLWADVKPQPMMIPGTVASSLATRERRYGSRIEREVKKEIDRVRPELNQEVVTAVLKISPEGRATTSSSPLLEVLFSTYEPNHLGVVDYHGPNRNYSRERIGNIKLTMDDNEQRMRQHALYDHTNKYSNLKSEMAAEYIRRMFSARGGSTAVETPESLIENMKELFKTFFPGKEFLGPQPTPDGQLLFPVRLLSGAQHDIDELSSGEKEVLYGYLRMRTAAPRNSVLLIDEPELHLNPRLVTGLASFYHRHLGASLGNQLWLVTHSDTLIRESVARGGFSVFHIQPAAMCSPDGQATRVRASEELERLVIDLVGDLAAYRPGAKVVIFESTGDAAFDLRMTRTLFPEFERQTNCISAGDKGRVANLYDLLEHARTSGQLHVKFFAITDLDDDKPAKGPDSRLQWDAYHIENYLLVPKYILRVCREVGISQDKLEDEAAVMRILAECAEETISSLVSHRMRVCVNRQLVSSFDLGIDPSRSDVSQAFHEAITKSSSRLQKRLENAMTLPKLLAIERKICSEYKSALNDHTWVRRFRGRDILRRFVGRLNLPIAYEPFRDFVLARMHDDVYKPPGMKIVIDRIINASANIAGPSTEPCAERKRKNKRGSP